MGIVSFFSPFVKLHFIKMRATPTVGPHDSHRKQHLDLSALSGLTVQPDLAPVILHRMLDNGQAQPRTAAGLRVTFVHPEEPFKDAALILRLNSDSGIRYT